MGARHGHHSDIRAAMFIQAQWFHLGDPDPAFLPDVTPSPSVSAIWAPALL